MNIFMPPVLDERTDPRAMVHAISFCKTFGADHHVTLFNATAAGRIAFTALPHRLSKPNLYQLNKSKRPALILVGDDDDQVTGPLGWAATAQLVSWARIAVVHGAGADQRSYLMAVAAAEDFGRALLIETSSDAAEAWMTTLRAADVPSVMVVPPPGSVHPIENAT
ncbi:hypothetical protein HN018_19580 [Lichenicola cladoniae]|uniref:Uncharacterized protein n=1 Tax=Lichenicola cladoniae TaxID=1484109 RepID=A0A6M8HUE6_9PROT|nr:hypothetical protein [Lichenicola cladoniae]NPD66063.1 hypothetical protein [Acetobacteraceae bacterium]QKE91940.1 hypothetical protein HN018_19580 [Lichenicola cladoniae]